MSTFTLAISCLTTSNLPWFMDLTFQVPMQHCSLQHWALLLSPVTSTTGYCFCFGSIPSFFLELCLHWSPVAYWAPTNPGNSERDGNTRPPDLPLEVRKQQLEQDMEQQTGYKWEEGYIKAVYCHPAYLTYIQSISFKMVGWINHRLESRLPGKYQQPQICRWYHSNDRNGRETKEPLDEGERWEWKAGLKLNVQKTKIMGSDHITSWQLEGEKLEAWQIFSSWAPNSLQTVTATRKLKVTCSLEGKLWQI